MSLQLTLQSIGSVVDDSVVIGFVMSDIFCPIFLKSITPMVTTHILEFNQTSGLIPNTL